MIQDVLNREFSAIPATRLQSAPVSGRTSGLILPNLVVHADWSTGSAKRWLAQAVLGPNGRYRLSPPRPVGDTALLLRQLAETWGGAGTVFAGFDFPIGLPIAYARRTGIEAFPVFLRELAMGAWPDFFDVATRLDEVGLRRPFFPRGDATGLKQADFLRVLGFTRDELYRRCERARPERGAAAPLFWTVGGNQVGKAALAGWREVLCPALSDRSLAVALWPFDGPLRSLLKPGRTVIAETYPAECYVQLGVDLRRAPTNGKSGKRVQSSRAANAPTLLTWATDNGVELDPRIAETIDAGFGPGESGEDAFDAVVGLMGMLSVVLGTRPSGEPAEESIRRVEGWILGQPG
jgi:hypothetical protein